MRATTFGHTRFRMPELLGDDGERYALHREQRPLRMAQHVNQSAGEIFARLQASSNGSPLVRLAPHAPSGPVKIGALASLPAVASSQNCRPSSVGTTCQALPLLLARLASHAARSP